MSRSIIMAAIAALVSLTALAADCEQKCYDARKRCFDKGGDSKTCDPAYDRCKKGCK